MTERSPRNRASLRALAVLLACAAAVAPACRKKPVRPSTGQGVLLISIGELRADHLKLYGYDRQTMPKLKSLADAGIWFEDMWSTAPWSLPASASLLTGCDPYLARRRLPAGIPATVATRWNIPRQAPRLAQEFLREGWRTAAFIDDPLLAPVHGFSLGFETFIMESAPQAAEPAEGLSGLPLRLVQWMQTFDRGRDWFAYLQLSDLERTWSAPDPQWDTHFESRPGLAGVPPVGDAEHLYHAIPRARWSGGMQTLGEYEARYDGALSRLDSVLARLFSHLAQVGRLRDTTVCIVGTHGIGFGEAGLYVDHGALAESDLRVPWILHPRAEAGIASGQRVAPLASLLDVAPTLLDIAGLPAQPSMHGVSFGSYLRGRSASLPRTFAVARSGLQDGYLVIDPEWTLELTRPWVVDEEILASSWYGAPPPYERAPHIELLRRDGEHVEEERAAQEIQRLCALGAGWVLDVERLRGSLQTVDWLLSFGLDVEPDAVVLGPCAPQ
jgi:arylsulfatase A-like enzyme